MTDAESISSSNWPAPARGHVPRLAPDEVQVWRSGPASAEQIARFSAWLSPDERARVNAYARDGDRRRFITGRAMVRSLAANCLDISPLEVVVSVDERMKPSLSATLPVRFNLSHCDDAVMCAMALEREAGIDVENVRAIPNREAASAHVFCRREIERIQSAAAHLRDSVFLQLWVRKEALLKAAGIGLLDSPEQVDALADMPFVPHGEAYRVVLEDRMWTVRDLEAGDDFIASVVVEGDAAVTRCWTWIPAEF